MSRFLSFFSFKKTFFESKCPFPDFQKKGIRHESITLRRIYRESK